MVWVVVKRRYWRFEKKKVLETAGKAEGGGKKNPAAAITQAKLKARNHGANASFFSSF